VGLMLNPPDLRFKADGRQTVQAWQVRFPLRLRVQRPAAVQALADARRVVDQLRRAAEEAEFPEARLLVPDPDADEGRGASEFTIEQKSQREVRLQITLAVSLTLEGAGAFWAHAAAIAAAADFLQGFAQRPHEKGIEVDVQQARVLGKGAGPSEMGSGETT
jgi:hypothetical protein